MSTSMSRLYGRYRNSLRQFIKFGLVGGSGVVVNLFIYFLMSKLGPHEETQALGIPLTDFNVRWYHVCSMVAFLVANVWNFQLNRWWTFRSHHTGSKWLYEFMPFFLVGLAGQAVTLVVVTALMWTSSPVHLPRHIFDGSTGFRTAAYWAQLIGVLVAVPVTFFVNKFWTFRAIRRPLAPEEATDEVEAD